MPLRPANLPAAALLLLLFLCACDPGNENTERDSAAAADTVAVTAAPQTYASRASLQTCDTRGRGAAR